jgi:hypothetical protein
MRRAITKDENEKRILILTEFRLMRASWVVERPKEWMTLL